MITDRIGLHSALLPLLIKWFNSAWGWGLFSFLSRARLSTDSLVPADQRDVFRGPWDRGPVRERVEVKHGHPVRVDADYQDDDAEDVHP